MAAEWDSAVRRLLLQAEAEAFLVAEADCLDGRDFEAWLAMLTDDVKIWMPIVRNAESGGPVAETTAENFDANWFDEGIETLRQRVKQLATGVHWAEQPPSRTTRMVSNVRLIDIISRDGAATADDPFGDIAALAVRCRFLTYRNRNEDEQDFFIGKRNDTLCRADGGWRLARREVFLDQSVLLAKNLSIFF